MLPWSPARKISDKTLKKQKTKYPGLTRLELIHTRVNARKMPWWYTCAVFVKCHCVLQFFCATGVFFGWNTIVVRIPSPGQIQIEEGGGEDGKLTLRGQARSQCESKNN